jgi:hypothetical protein
MLQRQQRQIGHRFADGDGLVFSFFRHHALNSPPPCGEVDPA